MAKVGSWSVTPGNNNSTPPDGWPEGQAPSTINDCARQMMADIRTVWNDAQYFDMNNTPSFLTATTFSLGTADTVNFHIGRRLKLYDGGGPVYGTINSVSSTFVSVLLDSGNLTASLSSVAVAIISQQNSSLPDMVWSSRRNTIINASFDLWRRGSPIQPANNVKTYTADRFYWEQSSAAAVRISRAERSETSTNVPTIAQAGVLYNSAWRISISAADAALANGEYGILGYRMLGYDWRTIAHRPNILTFWAATNHSGIYSVALRNHPVSVSYVNNFTLSGTSTWTKFAFTIPEAPTSVSWNYSQSIGVQLSFCFGAGATYQGGAGNWTATSIFATSTTTNLLGNVGNVLMLTGIDLKAGTQIVPSDPTPYEDDLARCRLYYLPDSELATLAVNGGAPSYLNTYTFPTGMIGTPTVGVGAGSSTAIPTTVTLRDVSAGGFRYGPVSLDTTNVTSYTLSADAEL